MKPSAEDFKSIESAWCPGCGNFPILEALKKAYVALEIPPHRLLMVSGIGQAAKLPHYLKCNAFNGLHGRALPVAVAAKTANKDLTVVVSGGDGDTYGEGGNHFIHNLRRNPDITLVVHDNQIYGLTKGQASPTSDDGFVTKAQPHGAYSSRFNPLAVAITLGCGFVARGFAGDIEHLSGLIREAISYRGFSIIDVLQPCVSFNKKNTYKWYKERVYKLEESGYNPSDKRAAFDKTLEWNGKIPIGVIHKDDGSKPVFTDHFEFLKDRPLVEGPIDTAKLKNILEKFK
ncbi:MAG: 2-oxoacid ferredoxin oxidoreductase [Candidatus Omnitrophica bacterium CG1_02_49_10]|nr:MAG: 2-oxoacid ferredoxin oxidoreductase [Candidatus Omnitrophica bacterium CG1_02_49_10]